MIQNSTIIQDSGGLNAEIVTLSIGSGLESMSISMIDDSGNVQFSTITRSNTEYKVLKGTMLCTQCASMISVETSGLELVSKIKNGPSTYYDYQIVGECSIAFKMDPVVIT